MAEGCVNFTVGCQLCGVNPGEDCIWLDADDKRMAETMPHASRIKAQKFLDEFNCPSEVA